jgi:hypothetical protein
MASEDSVENFILWGPPALAISVDGIGKLDELHDPFESPVVSLAHQVDRGREDLVVGYARRMAHVASEERNHSVPKDLTVPELQDQHLLVPGLGKDGARPELLRSQLQETSSIPVLIQKELRLNEVAESSRRMPFERHTHAAFSFNEAG